MLTQALSHSDSWTFKYAIVDAPDYLVGMETPRNYR